MNEVKRIIICRLGGIGDVIHTLPLVEYLRKKHRNASIEYITSANTGELLSGSCPFIDKVWTFEKSKKKQLASEILKFNPPYPVDYFFNLHTSLSLFFFNLFYIRAKKFFQYKKDNGVHAVVNFGRTYEQNISASALSSKTLLVNGDARDILNKHQLKESRYVCLVLGVGRLRPHRAWPIANWVSLTKELLSKQTDFKVVYLGGGDEEGLCAYLPESNRILNLIGKSSLLDTAKVISKTAYLVSCDTGLLHLASAIGVKVIGIYGPTLPKRSGPFTNDYRLLTAKNCKCIGWFKDLKKCRMIKNLNGYCMDSLTVDNVLSNVSNANMLIV